MGRCMYCGQPAGFLTQWHRECREEHADVVNRIARVVGNAEIGVDDATKKIRLFIERYNVEDSDLELALKKGLNKHTEEGLENFTYTKEQRLNAIFTHFGKHGRYLWSDTFQTMVYAQRRNLLLSSIEEHLAKLALETINKRIVSTASAYNILTDVENDIIAMACSQEANVNSPDDLLSHMTYLQESAYGDLGSPTARVLAVHSLESGIEHALQDDSRSSKEKRTLDAMRMRVFKAAILRDFEDGIEWSGWWDISFGDGVSIPFRLQKTEDPIWMFQDVSYGTVLVNPFDRRSEAQEGAIYVETGILVITSRHLYFAGKTRSFRIRLDRIVAIERRTDGVRVMRDNARAQWESLRLDDDYFAYKLLQRL